MAQETSFERGSIQVYSCESVLKIELFRRVLTEIFVRPAALLPSERGLLFVLDKSEVIGALSFIGSGPSEFEITQIGLCAKFRGKGLFSQVLDGFFKTVQPEVVRLEVGRNNLSAIKGYTQAGFREIGLRKRYYPDGQDALILERRLFQTYP